MAFKRGLSAGKRFLVLSSEGLVVITENLSPFHGDEAAPHHLLQFRQEGFDLMGLVYDLHNNW